MSTPKDIPTLETERFIMRPLVRDDAISLFPTLSDEDQCRYMLTEAFASEEALGDWLCEPGWNGRSWSAVDRKTEEVCARIVAVPSGERTSELGYITVKHRQGEGIALECSIRLLDHLFAQEDHHRVVAGTDPRNSPSNRILEKLGFRREAHYVQSVKTHIGWCDEYYWGLLASEWRERG